MRRFVCGDIHGGYRALKELLDTIQFNYDEDQLISVGDVCDGWSETPEAIDLLMSIKYLVYIKGNHDEWAQEYLGQPIDFNDNYQRSWLHHGGRATAEAYERVGTEKMKEHVEFLNDARLYHIDSQNNLFVHAGFTPSFVPGTQDIDTVPKHILQELYWDRTFWNSAYNGKHPGKDFNKVFIGHTPTLNFPNSNLEHMVPMTRGNIINMDTGAAFTGKLSIMNIETGEVFQSGKFVMEYYPYEFGRNQTAFARYKNTEE
jgi:serine/threonine protein phosphatase 1